MKKSNAKLYYGAGLLLAGLAAGTAAAAAVLIHKKNNEKVFREAELRAMEEMDDLTPEDADMCGDVPAGTEEDTGEIDIPSQQPIAEDLLKDLVEETSEPEKAENQKVAENPEETEKVKEDKKENEEEL